MKKILIWILGGLLTLYVTACILLYFFQEKLVFHPDKLNKDFSFTTTQPFEEIFIKTKDNLLLDGLLFKSDSSKGLIFYLHGNAGSLNSWVVVAKTYTDLHYDVFLLDYRGFGKSQGQITSQEQLYGDLQDAYDIMSQKYDEKNIVILGYSIGTGLAAHVASTNHPKLLILQAPYYNLTDIMKENYPIIPTFILKYKFETNLYIKDCKIPIAIFHGNSDSVVPYASSLKLKLLLKKDDIYVTLDGQGHNRITYNPEYIKELTKLLR